MARGVGGVSHPLTDDAFDRIKLFGKYSMPAYEIARETGFSVTTVGYVLKSKNIDEYRILRQGATKARLYRDGPEPEPAKLHRLEGGLPALAQAFAPSDAGAPREVTSRDQQLGNITDWTRETAFAVRRVEILLRETNDLLSKLLEEWVQGGE